MIKQCTYWRRGARISTTDQLIHSLQSFDCFKYFICRFSDKVSLFKYIYSDFDTYGYLCANTLIIKASNTITGSIHVQLSYEPGGSVQFLYLDDFDRYLTLKELYKKLRDVASYNV